MVKLQLDDLGIEFPGLPGRGVDGNWGSGVFEVAGLQVAKSLYCRQCITNRMSLSGSVPSVISGHLVDAHCCWACWVAGMAQYIFTFIRQLNLTTSILPSLLHHGLDQVTAGSAEKFERLLIMADEPTWANDQL